MPSEFRPSRGPGLPNDSPTPAPKKPAGKAPVAKKPVSKAPPLKAPPPQWWDRPIVLRRLLAGAAVAIVALTVAVVVLAATGDESGGSQAAPTPTPGYSPYYFPTTTANPPSTAATGLFKLGEPITLSSKGSVILTYSVTSIVVDGPCPDSESGNNPEHGHMVLVALDVQTTDVYTSDYDEVLSPYKGGWAITGPDGITETGITSGRMYGCADRQIPRTRAPNSHYAYKLAFDSRNTQGTLRYQVDQNIHNWSF